MANKKLNMIPEVEKFYGTFNNNHFLSELEVVQASEQTREHKLLRPSMKQFESTATKDSKIILLEPSIKYERNHKISFPNDNGYLHPESGFRDDNYSFGSKSLDNYSLNTIDTGNNKVIKIYKDYKSNQIPGYFVNNINYYDDTLGNSENLLSELMGHMPAMDCNMVSNQLSPNISVYDKVDPRLVVVEKLDFHFRSSFPSEEMQSSKYILRNYNGWVLDKTFKPEETGLQTQMENLNKSISPLRICYENIDKSKKKDIDGFTSNNVVIKQELSDPGSIENSNRLQESIESSQSNTEAPSERKFNKQRDIKNPESRNKCVTERILMCGDAFRNQPEIWSLITSNRPRAGSDRKKTIKQCKVTQELRISGIINKNNNPELKRKACHQSSPHKETIPRFLKLTIIKEEYPKEPSCQHEGCRLDHKKPLEPQFNNIYEALPFIKFEKNRYQIPDPSTYKKWGKLIFDKRTKCVTQDRRTGIIIVDERSLSGNSNINLVCPIVDKDLYPPIFRRKILRKYACYHSNSTIKKRHLKKIEEYQKQHFLYQLSYNEIIEIMPIDNEINGPNNGEFLEPEGYCGTCNEFFEMRNAKYALHMRTRHGLCHLSRGPYSLPEHIRIIRNVNEISGRKKSSILTRVQGWCGICNLWQNIDHQVCKPWGLWWEHQESHRKIKRKGRWIT